MAMLNNQRVNGGNCWGSAGTPTEAPVESRAGPSLRMSRGVGSHGPSKRVYFDDLPWIHVFMVIFHSKTKLRMVFPESQNWLKRKSAGNTYIWWYILGCKNQGFPSIFRKKTEARGPATPLRSDMSSRASSHPPLARTGLTNEKWRFKQRKLRLSRKNGGLTIGNIETWWFARQFNQLHGLLETPSFSLI